MNRTAVFYQRSKAIKKSSSNAGVIWETPINLSNYIDANPYGIKTTWDCAYPSIVIRKDGTTDKAYVAFGCRDTLEEINVPIVCPDTAHHFHAPICETVISLANDGAVKQSSNMIYKSVRGPFPQDWANVHWSIVNVSAAAPGNFYTWADSICGIGVGFKTPSDLVLNINNIRYFKANPLGIAKHPAINTYSDIDSGANDCSIVWQEKLGTYRTQIYYTRFKWTGTLLLRYKPVIKDNAGRLYTNLYMALSNPIEECAYPTIFRTPKSLKLSNVSFIQQEVIGWESTPSLVTNIALKTIYFPHNNSFVYSQGILYPTTYIMGSPPYLFNSISYSNVVFSQPASYANQPYNRDTSYRYMVNFVKHDNYSPNYIEHFEPNFYNMISSGNKIGTYSLDGFQVAEGKNPHLAIAPKNNILKIWKNRRVFEDSVITGGTPSIQPNARYFYAVPGQACCTKTALIGHQTGNGKFNITNVNTTPPGGNMSVLPYNTPYQQVVDTVNGNYYLPTKSDTLYSDWFHVDSVASLSYLLNFTDTNNVKLKIQRQSTGTFTFIPAPFIPNSEFMNLVYFLVNGNNDNYRVAMITTDTNAVYSESLIENFFIADTIYAKGAVDQHENHQIINLRPEQALNDEVFLDIHPNPANEYLNVVTYTTNGQKVNYTIYNSQGLEVLKLNGKSNYSYQIDTQNLKTGMYIVKTETDTGIIKIQKLLIAK